MTNDELRGAKRTMENGELAPRATEPTLVMQVPDGVLDRIAERVAVMIAAHARDASAEPWIGVAEAAKHLHCRPQRIYALVHQGRLIPRREGSRLLFRRTELDAWLRGEAHGLGEASL